MALSRTVHAANSSFAPGAVGDLIVLAIAALRNDTNSPWTPSGIAVSGGGLSWTRRVDVAPTRSDWNLAVQVWTAVAASTSSISITITKASGDANYYGSWFRAITYSGANTASPVGVTATDDTFGADGAQSLTLSGAPASSSEVVGIIGGQMYTGIGNADVGSGYTSLFAQGTDGEYMLEGQYRTGSTDTSAGWSDVYGVGSSGSYFYDTLALAFEIKEAAGGAATSFVQAAHRLLLPSLICQ